MMPFTHLEQSALQQAVDAFRAIFSNAKPKVGLILGSGWNSIVPFFNIIHACSFSTIPGMGTSTVPGHEGTIALAECRNVQTLLFQGRRHWYEGAGWLPILLPIVLMKHAGAQAVVLTNSAGGIREDLDPGSVALIADHLNLMGVHPLLGPHQPMLGPRFPDMSEVYDRRLRQLIQAVAVNAEITVKEGVYAALSGPSYETPAEVRMLAGLGADLVGMSTVPEAIIAAACGLRVAGLSCVTNRAAGLSDKPLSHAEVLAILNASGDRLGRLLDKIWERLPEILS